MAVSIAPSIEAMTALRDRINAGQEYCLEVDAEYREQQVDSLTTLDHDGLAVDIVSESEEQLNETLDVEDRTSHLIRIWIRKKVSDLSNDSIDPLKLLVRQLFQRVNNWDSADRRVKVWECEMDPKEVPDKTTLNQLGIFLASVLMRVEVEAS